MRCSQCDKLIETEEIYYVATLVVGVKDYFCKSCGEMWEDAFIEIRAADNENKA